MVRKKIQIFILALILLFTVINVEINENYTYDDFIKQFNRTYQGEEKLHHQQIFKQNLAKLIEDIKNGKDLQITKFLDWNQTQLRGLLIEVPQDIKSDPLPLRSSLNNQTPKSFDWRQLNKISSIKDQGQCGSCWAFSSVAQYQSILAIQTGKMYDLSQQFAVQCDTTAYGCEGGFPANTLQFFNITGVPLQSKYLYQQYKISNYYSFRNIPICSEKNTIKLYNYNLRFYTDLPDDYIQYFLVQYGPLTVSIFSNFQDFYKTGYSGSVICPASNKTTHSVLLIGYNTSHWILKNSWGQFWGRDGYFYLDKTNTCNMKYYTVLQNLGSWIEFDFYLNSTGLNGWEGNTLAIIQNGIVMADVGTNFKNGSKYGPQKVKLIPNVETQIIVGSYNSSSNVTMKLGFYVVSLYYQKIYEFKTGQGFQPRKIFYTFCPKANQCPPPKINYTYTIQLDDTHGDGWQGVQYCLIQNQASKSFGKGFTSGYSYKQQVILKRFEQVNVAVCNKNLPRGYYSANQIGFKIKDQKGNLYYQKKPGARFSLTSSKSQGSFSPQSYYFGSVNIVKGERTQQIVASSQKVNQNEQDQNENGKKVGLIIGVVVGSVVIIGLIVVIIIVLITRRRSKNGQIKKRETQDSEARLKKSKTDKQNSESASNIMKNIKI